MVNENDKKRNKFVLDLVKTAGIITKSADHFFRLYGITSVQYNVLVILKYLPPGLTHIQLGKELIVSRANVTGIIDRLARLGYVGRSYGEKDRRVKHLYITEKGRSIIKEVEKTYFKKIREITSFVSDAEIEKAVSIISKLKPGV
jgi:MarR family 2-MHQ and catechol resistance regulon transcriptional repressor